jgi:sucrose-6F-phosphate phosphohydrolase
MFANMFAESRCIAMQYTSQLRLKGNLTATNRLITPPLVKLHLSVQAGSMSSSMLVNEDAKKARELLDFQPQLRPRQQLGIGAASLASFFLLSAELVSPSVSVIISLIFALSIRSWLLEQQFQAVMRDASACGDEDSLFSSIPASELQLTGQESINVHYKAVQSKVPPSHSMTFYHGFGSNLFSFEDLFQMLRKDGSLSVSAIAHDCPGFGLSERKGNYGYYLLSTNGRIGSAVRERRETSKPPRARRSNPFMLSSDLDGTMVGIDDDGTQELKEFWASTHGCKLCYNTGRSFGSVLDLLREKKACLARPDALVCGVGAQIFLPSSSNQDGWKEDKEWSDSLDEGWDIGKVVSAVDRAIIEMAKASSSLPFTAYYRPKEDQQRHKCSLAVHVSLLGDVLASINADLDAGHVKRNVIISYHGDLRVLDIIPINGGKRNAMEYLRRLWGFSPDSTVAAGDSANDILMLDGEHRSIAVGNSQPDLRHWLEDKRAKGGKSLPVLTKASEAKGILEGLRHFGFIEAPKLILIGHSMGSLSASQEALRLHKEGVAVDGLVLIAPIIIAQSLAQAPQGLMWLIKGLMSAASLTLLCILRVVRPLVISLLRSLVRSKTFWTNGLSSSYADSSKLKERMVENYQLPSIVKGWEAGLCFFTESRLLPLPQDSDDLMTQLSNLPPSCPVLIVHGRQDRLVPLGNSIGLAKRLKCRLEVIEDCGHSPQEETPSALFKILCSFIKQHQ